MDGFRRGSSARVIGLFVVALAVVACSVPGPSIVAGTPTPATGGSTKPDPCTLLSPADLKAEFGTDFQPGHLVGTTSAPHVECDFAKQNGVTAWVTLYIDDIGSSGFGCLGNAQTIPGLGDQACGGGGSLHIKHGSWDVSFLAGSEEITDQQLIDLGRVVVSHLT